ncbi:hypothetical protein L6164_019141 [Bauhinia variegata]|uniref:Uncharacterized protein n=1 Tax=Bauhinia variegata TaxID=167791 RepID=A0ACB9NE58_BAUVA|nr:hypothetical protein L6164_019141 [Bauhinia variegata]
MQTDHNILHSRSTRWKFADAYAQKPEESITVSSAACNSDTETCSLEMSVLLGILQCTASYEIKNGSLSGDEKAEYVKIDDGTEKVLLSKKPGTEKRNAPAVKPPPNAAPFSDEWLAAMETAES